MLDASLQPVLLPGSTDNQEIFADFNDSGTPQPGTAGVTFPSAGLYYLRLSFWNGCAPAVFQLAATGG